MQNVSRAYRESMKEPLRNRGYMRVVFGGIFSKAQDLAVISGNQAPQSYPSYVFKSVVEGGVYATLEENFTKVDGSMLFAPANWTYYGHSELGFVGEPSDWANPLPYTFVISFGGNEVSFSVMTFNFGDNYPLRFTITDNYDNAYSFENDDRICTIEQLFEDVTELTITVTEMRLPISRVRIYSVTFDLGLEYQNDMILDSSFDSSFSPICENLPQMNFSLRLINQDHYFDTDNPKSILNQFNTNTEMNVYYGYEVEDRIEWLEGAKLYVESWSSDEDSATINARDILQANDRLYSNGKFGQISLYNLAVDIFTQMGISDYEIDDALKTMYTNNPMPVVSCKEALQIVANAGCMKLFILRNGTIKIGEDNYVDEAFTLSTNNQLPYSYLDNIKRDIPKYNYATLEENVTRVDESVYFLPVNQSVGYLSQGYISESISDELGRLKVLGGIETTERVLFGNVLNMPYILGNTTIINNPKINIHLTVMNVVTGIHLIFGATYASQFMVRTYRENDLVEQHLINNNQRELTIDLENREGINRIEIEFLETAIPNTRVRVDFLELAFDNTYKHEYTDIDYMTHPKFTKSERIGKISVPFYTYQRGTAEEQLLNETVTVDNVNTVYTFSMSEPASNYRVVSSSGYVTIVESGAYKVSVCFSSIGSKTITIYGYKYEQIEQETEEVISDNENVIRWENPIVCSKTMSENLLAWLKEYYLLEGYYEFSTRGDPEIDVNDRTTQLKYNGEKMNVLITELSLGFNGAFSGSVKTLKEGSD